MPESDVHHTVSTQTAPRHVDVAYLPSAYARDASDPLRAIAFWNGQHQYEPATDTARFACARPCVRSASAPSWTWPLRLLGLARDPRPAVRVTFATCFSILAKAGQAPADREVWRALLGLAKYDDDAEVRTAAERALADFEHCGLVAQPAESTR